MIKISFVISAFNVENYIGTTLNTLLSQENKDFDVLIIDDGSTDNTNLIITEFIKKNDLQNFKLIHKENGGASSARNKGLSEASGEYVLFLDGDDYISNNLVSTLCNAIKEDKYDMICWKFNPVSPDGQLLGEFSKIYHYNDSLNSGINVLYNIIIKNFHIWTGSTAYNREFIIRNEFKYSEEFFFGEDLEFTYKALIRAAKVRFIDETLSYYVQRIGSLTNSYNITKFCSINALKSVQETIEKSDDFVQLSLLQKFKYDMILDNYFWNFKYCTKLLYMQNHSIKNATDKVLKDLQKDFPEIEGLIKKLVKNYKGDNCKLFISSIIYNISPYLYTYLYIISNKIKNSIREC